MRVLLLNCVYQKGSTGKIVADIKTTLEKCHVDCYVAYGRGSYIREEKVYKFCYEFEAKLQAFMTRLGCPQFGGCLMSTLRLISHIKKIKPDVVHVHCINGYCVNIYKLLRFLGKNHINTVVTHHAEFFYTGSCGHAFDCKQFANSEGCKICPQRKVATASLYRDTTHYSWLKMKESFDSFDNSHILISSVSPWTDMRSKMSPIVNRFSHVVVLNGVDTDVFSYRLYHNSSENNNLSTFETPFLLHVTASFSDAPEDAKGGVFIIKLARLLPQYKIVVVSSLINLTCELPTNIYIIGKVSSREQLARLYSSASLTVIASKRETFSMVCAESLCCGTPVVGFKAGGPESIALNDHSEFVDYGDVNLLADSCQQMLLREIDRGLVSKKAIGLYDKRKMAQNYLSLYQSLINNS